MKEEELDFEKSMNKLYIMLGVCALLVLATWVHVDGIPCKISTFNNEDAYCKLETRWIETTSNVSAGSYRVWVERSHEQDRLNEIENKRIAEERRMEQERIQRYYDEGHLVNQSFSIEDYGLNCKKIDYLNNHLIDDYRQMDAGSIEGSFSGIFSYGHISGQQYAYINERVLAVGKLIQNINYWEGSDGTKHHEQVNYYTEGDFVVYYMEECLE